MTRLIETEDGKPIAKNKRYTSAAAPFGGASAKERRTSALLARATSAAKKPDGALARRLKRAGVGTSRGKPSTARAQRFERMFGVKKSLDALDAAIEKASFTAMANGVKRTLTVKPGRRVFTTPKGKKLTIAVGRDANGKQRWGWSVQKAVQELDDAIEKAGLLPAGRRNSSFRANASTARATRGLQRSLKRTLGRADSEHNTNKDTLERAGKLNRALGYLRTRAQRNTLRFGATAGDRK